MASVADYFRKLFLLTGQPYVYGAEFKLGDPDPKGPGDCSEIQEWATHQIGLYLPDGAMNQLAFCRQKRTTMSVRDGLRTRGALLFHGPTNPHVATSIGDSAHTFEARGRKYPIGVFAGAASRPWTAAAWIPGMTHDTTPTPAVQQPPPPTPQPLRTRTVGYGETGSLVAALQYELVGLTGAILNGEDTERRYGDYTRFAVANAARYFSQVLGYHQFDGHNGIGVAPELFRYIDLFFAKNTGQQPIPG